MHTRRVAQSSSSPTIRSVSRPHRLRPRFGNSRPPLATQWQRIDDRLVQEVNHRIGHDRRDGEMTTFDSCGRVLQYTHTTLSLEDDSKSQPSQGDDSSWLEQVQGQGSHPLKHREHAYPCCPTAQMPIMLFNQLQLQEEDYCVAQR